MLQDEVCPLFNNYNMVPLPSGYDRSRKQGVERGITPLNITPSDTFGGICGSYSYSSRLSRFRESGSRM